jgi:hypothetical protein
MGFLDTGYYKPGGNPKLVGLRDWVRRVKLGNFHKYELGFSGKRESWRFWGHVRQTRYPMKTR